MFSIYILIEQSCYIFRPNNDSHRIFGWLTFYISHLISSSCRVYTPPCYFSWYFACMLIYVGVFLQVSIPCMVNFYINSSNFIVPHSPVVQSSQLLPDTPLFMNKSTISLWQTFQKLYPLVRICVNYNFYWIIFSGC